MALGLRSRLSRPRWRRRVCRVIMRHRGLNRRRWDHCSGAPPEDKWERETTDTTAEDATPSWGLKEEFLTRLQEARRAGSMLPYMCILPINRSICRGVRGGRA